MKRREFVNKTGISLLGMGVLPLASCVQQKKEEQHQEVGTSSSAFEPFVLPRLKYPDHAMEPHIDAKTMKIHHDMHHAGYVKKLNAALENHELAGKSLEVIMESVKESEKDLAVRNNGGGHFNHSLYWKIMTPDGPTKPSGNLKSAITEKFGSFDEFETQFTKEASSVFGSGWTWLAFDEQKKLFITSTPNQDNPLMKNIVERTGTPILGIDVWEHAYYLKYQNRRSDYIKNFMEIVNWNTVGKLFG